jgi:hypothetical protein
MISTPPETLQLSSIPTSGIFSPQTVGKTVPGWDSSLDRNHILPKPAPNLRPTFRRLANVSDTSFASQFQWDTGLLRRFLAVDNVYTYKVIPPHLRLRITALFEACFQHIISTPDDISFWVELFILPRAILSCWPSGDPRYKLRSRKRKQAEYKCISENIDAWKAGGVTKDKLVRSVFGIQTSAPAKEFSESRNIHRCLKLAREDGQFGKAVKALFSHGVAPPSPEVTNILRTKHPNGIPLQANPSDLIDSFKISSDDIQHALKSFPKGTGCGRSGLRVNHLLNLISPNIPSFLDKLTAVLNIAASGKAPKDFAPFLASAPLVPLYKKDQSIRPIAVGEVLRRIISKVALRKAMSRVVDYLCPLQVGVGLSNGAEAIVHAINRYIADPNLHNSTVVGMVDYENAFNKMSRQAFYDILLIVAPDLAAWVFYSYGCDALLFSGTEIIEAKTGVQQGDPLGPMLFALALQPLLVQLQSLKVGNAPSPLVVAYLDDVTFIAHTPEVAAACLKFLSTEGIPLGLCVSTTKSLLWQPSCSPSDLRRHVGKAAAIHLEDGVELLGGAVTIKDSFAAAVAQKRVNKCITCLEKLPELKDPQIALLLLRSCLGMPKLVYSWRTTPPSALCDASETMTLALTNILKWIVTGYGPRFGPFQLSLAGLPLKLGGLGISLPQDILPFAHLSSQLDSLSLQHEIFPCLSANTEFLRPIYEGFLSFLLPSSTGSLPSFDALLSLPKHQKNLAAMYYKSKRMLLENNEYLRRKDFSLFTIQHRMVLQSFCPDLYGTVPNKSLSHQWLLALPNGGLGQVMTPVEFRSALHFRLLIPMRNCSSLCDLCKKRDMDIFGYHALSCGGVGSRRTRRHNTVVDALYDISQGSGFHPTANAPVQCLETTVNNVTMLRPADLLIDGDARKQVCVDVTIVSPLSMAKSVLPEGRVPGFLAKDAAKRKIEKHALACTRAEFEFIPFALDVCGAADKDGWDLLQRLSHKWSEHMGKPYAYALSLARRRISFAVQLGVSRQLSPLLCSNFNNQFTNILG